jgi:hypothetical protein
VLGSFDGRTHRVAEPAGGSIATDIAGTAQGAWFHPSQPTKPEGPHLAITPDAVDPSRVLVSIGLSQPGLGAGAYVMVPATSGTTNRAPWLITPGSTIHCWEIGYGPTDRRGVLLVALDDATTLRVEARPGATQSCESSPYAFTTNSFTYKR